MTTPRTAPILPRWRRHVDCKDPLMRFKRSRSRPLTTANVPGYNTIQSWQQSRLNHYAVPHRRSRNFGPDFDRPNSRQRTPVFPGDQRSRDHRSPLVIHNLGVPNVGEFWFQLTRKRLDLIEICVVFEQRNKSNESAHSKYDTREVDERWGHDFLVIPDRKTSQPCASNQVPSTYTLMISHPMQKCIRSHRSVRTRFA